MELDPFITTARFVHEAALFLLFGMSLFPFYLPQTLRLAGVYRVQIAFLSWLSLVSAILWLAAYLADVGDDGRSLLSLPSWRDFLLETELGRVWSVRLSGLLGLAGLATARLWSTSSVRSSLIVALSGALLVGLSWMGHAASGKGAARTMGLANHAFHVVAAAAWLGGLAQLMRVLRRTNVSLDYASARSVLEGFSRMGIVAVALIAATGVLNTYLRSTGLGSLQTTTYGRLLALKVLLFIVLVGIAACNRWVYLRQLKANPNPRLIGALRCSVALELIVGTAVIAIAVILALSSPTD